MTGGGTFEQHETTLIVALSDQRRHAPRRIPRHDDLNRGVEFDDGALLNRQRGRSGDLDGIRDEMNGAIAGPGLIGSDVGGVRDDGSVLKPARDRRGAG